MAPRAVLRLSGVKLMLITVVLLASKCQSQTTDYSFDQEIYIVTEGTDSMVEVYVTRSASVIAVGDSSVDVMTADRTALSGTDYTAVTSTLDFQNGIDRVPVTVPIGNDTDDQFTLRCFSLTLMNPTPSGNLSAATLVCIIDDDNAFGGTCPPPEALSVIEYNADDDIEEAVIEASVVSSTIPVSWTDPSVSYPPASNVYNCYQQLSQGYNCNNGDAFPITDTLVAYNGRILVENLIFHATLATAKCNFFVRVRDSVPPEITCPENVTAAAGDGYMNGTASWNVSIGTDNSNDVTTTSDFSLPAVFNIGTHEVTYTAIDASGNTASCSFIVTITDLTDPDIQCPMTNTTDTDMGKDFATVTWETTNATDNSGEIIIPVASLDSGSQFGVGNTTVTLTATDSHGNDASCSFFIVVEDNERPNITCPSDEEVETNATLNVTSYVLQSANTSDNTGVVSITIDVDGSVQSVGDTVSLILESGLPTVHTLVYTATDQYGNNASCSVNVTVIDTEKPELTCPDNVISNLDEGFSTANVTFDSANVTDNSQIVITPEADIMSGSTFETGETVVQFNATDPSGNTGTCTFTVTVKDLEPPVLVDCADLTFSTSPGLSTADVTYYLPNATDNVIVMSVDCFGVDEAGETLDVGIHTVTCVALDTANLESRCMFNITVEDNERPNITCPSDETVETNATFNVASYVLLSANTSDNTGVVSITIDVDGSVQSVGDTVSLILESGVPTVHTLVYTATDQYGNNASCSVNVTVIDTEKPELTCPDNVISNLDEGFSTANVTFDSANVTDNSQIVIMPEADIMSGSTFETGETVVQFNARDPSGNNGTCTFTVTVKDLEPPVLVDCADLTFSTSPGLSTADVTYYLPNATDNVIVMSVDCFGVDEAGETLDVGIHTVTCVALDTANLESRCMFNITVEDNERPNITCPSDEEVETNATFNVASYVLLSANTSDNTGVVSITIDVDGSVQSVGDTVSLILESGVPTVHTLVYTATDQYGNNASCSVNVTVIDTEKPELTCPDNVISNLDEGFSTANVTFDSANVTDNSQIVIMPEADIMSGSTFETGETVVQFNARDPSGNNGTCTFTVTVKDLEPPVLVDCADLTFSTSPGLSTADVTYYLPNATDNVIVMSVDCFGVDEAGETLDVGIHTVTCVALDTANLESRCMFNITVEDNERPNITCPSDEEVETDATLNVTSYVLLSATTSDNTGVVNITIDVDGSVQSVGDTVDLILVVGLPTPYTLVYTATDQYGNNASCSMVVTVIDTEKPELTCPDNVTSNLDEGFSTATVTFDAATVTDNSQIVLTPEADIMSGSTFEIGETVVQFNATDPSGNNGTCTFIVLVQDLEPPVLVDCADLTFSTSPGLSTADVTYYLPNATDNVMVVSVNCSGVDEAGETLDVGIHTVTCIARDTANLESSCMFNITVEDNERPNITCPSDEEVETDATLNVTSYVLLSATTSDNTGVVNITIDVDGSVQSVGDTVDLILVVGLPTPYTLVYTATDQYGNNASCSMVVTVIGCGDSVSLILESGSSNVYTLMYTASDQYGNNVTCRMDVTVIDKEAPVLVCPSNQVNVVPDNELSGTAMWSEPQITDNSGIITSSGSTISSGAVFEVGVETTVWYNATDPSGNRGNCSFTILVIDNVPPNITCPGDITEPTALNKSYAPVTWDEPTITDNVPATVTYVADHDNGTDFELGETTVTLTATDAAGNNATCQFVITVIDTQKPVIYGCPSDFNITTETDRDYGIANFTEPTAWDNSGSVEMAGLGRSGDRFSIGTHEIVYVAVDAADNFAVCRVNIYVLDEQNPQLQAASQCPADILIFIQDTMSSNATVIWTMPPFEDNSGVAPTVTVTPMISGTVFPEGNTTVTIEAEDSSGNTFACVFLVTVSMYDMTPPVFSQCPPSVLSVDTDPDSDVASPYDFGVTVSDSGSGVETSVLSVSEPLEIGDNWVSLYAVDFAGNVAYCNFTVTVLDTQKPNITNCPENSTLPAEWDSAFGSLTWPLPSAWDNSGDVMVNCTPQSGDDFRIGDTTVECVAVDPSNNTAMCSFVVTVLDEQPPNVTFCPPNVETGTDPDVNNAIVSWALPTASDNDELPVVASNTHGSNTAFQLGVTPVSFSFTDTSDNVAYCNFTITVTDDEAPVVQPCPNDTLVFTPVGTATAPALWVEPSSTDNVLVINANNTHSPGDEFPIGLTTVTYRAWDAAGLVGMCQFVVEVQDTEKPVFFLCPLPINQATDSGRANATVFWTPPNVTDNSGIIDSMEISNYPGEIFDIGVHTVTYTAVDEDNNIGTCSFGITITDEEDPVFVTCRPNVTVYVPADSTEVSYIWPFPSATDNAGPPTLFNATYTETLILSQSPVTVTVDWEAGFTTVTVFKIGCYECVIRATDEAGNTAECVTQFWIIDRNEPAFDMCPPGGLMPFYGTDLDSPTAYVTWTTPVITDNTGGDVDVQSDQPDGNVFAVGSTLVTITATDESSNVATCTFNVTVNDLQAPNLTCPDAQSFETDAFEAYSTSEWPPPTVFDNYSPYQLTASVNPGDQLTVGTHNITYTAVDEAGNLAECTFTVVVNDSSPPYFSPSCPDSFTVPTDSGQDTATVSWVQVVALDNVAVVESGANYQPGSILPIGDTWVEYNATDSSGLYTACDFTVTVVDEEDPTITCPGQVIIQDTDLLKSTANLTYDIVANDNSGEWTVECNPPSGSDFPISVTNVICTATDPYTNHATCSFAVLITDDEEPVFAFCPPDIVLNEPAESFVDFTLAVNWTDPVVSDNVGVDRLEMTDAPGSAFNIGSHVVQYTAFDAAGNMATCQFNVVVNDIQPPVFTSCPADLPPFPMDPTLDTARATWPVPQVSDNSGSVVVTSNYDSGDDFSEGDTLVRYTAADASGNSVNCTFVVQVYDNQPPSFTGCPLQGVTTTTSLQSDTGVASWTAPEGVDNVAVASVQSDHRPGDTFPLGPTVVTYNVTDTAGLLAECSFTVVVQDMEPPVIQCPDDIRVTIFTHQAEIAVDYPAVNATDYASGLDSLNCTEDSGAVFQIGLNDVTCTAEDLESNFNFCIFQVIVTGTDDTTPPEISNCPPNITLPADNTTSTTIVTWTLPTAADNSGESVNLVSSRQPGTPFGLGITIVTYTATDVVGLTSTCVFSVTILDLENPDILECPADITRPADLGMDSAAVDWPSPGVVDNSGSVVMESDTTPGQEFDIGVTTVTYTAVDSDGNVEKCSFQIEIVDEEEPVITGCPTDTLIHETELGQNYSLVTWDDITVCDNSGNWSVTRTGPTQGQIEVGEHQVTYVATDMAGNMAECSFTVQVRDTEPPAFSNCPSSLVKLVGTSGQAAQVTWDDLLVTDNVGVDFGSLGGSHNSNDEFQFGGPTPVSSSVLDVSGNTHFCTFTVTVSDDPLAVSNCPVYIRVPTEPGLASAVVTWDAPDVEPAGASVDTQSLPYSSGDRIPLGRYNITHSINNTLLQSASCDFVVEVFDNEPPTWDICPSDASATPAPLETSAPVTWAQPVAQDNSGSVDVSPGSHDIGDIFPVGQITVSYTASDAAGHEITCSFVVTVLDHSRPQLTCPPSRDVFTDLSKGTATIWWPDANATDNVAVTSLVSTPPNGTPLEVGVNTITYTATDQQENVGMCTFDITVSDNEPPVFSNCPDVVTVVAPVDEDMAIAVWSLPWASDNAVTVTVESFQQSAVLYPLGVTPALYLATDAAGNQANCTFDVIVLDEQSPEFHTCPASFTRNTALGERVALGVVWTMPVASDNDPLFTTESTVDPPANFDYGPTLVRYTAMDRAGNMDLCEFTVNVLDMEPPEFAGCPGSIGIPADLETATANVTWTPPMPRDNVGILSSDSTHVPNTIFSLGVTVVQYTATDLSGTVGICTFNVTVLDSHAPMLANCPTDQTFCADLGTSTRSVSWIEPTASDNAGPVTIVGDYSPGDTFNHNDGIPTLVSYTATDEAGLQASCSFNILIRDCERPEFTGCPAPISQPGDSGGGTTTVSWTEPTAFDVISGQVQLSKTHSPGDTFTAAASPTYVQYTAVDPSGNTNMCTFEVVVTDTTDPVINGCPSDQSIFTNPNQATGSATWTPPTVAATPTDPVTLSESHPPGFAFPVGSNPVTYMATDSSGNQAHCRFSITVTDNIDPVISNCPNAIFRSTDSGSATAAVSWTVPTASDNVGPVELTSNLSPGSDFAIGTTDVVYTATDPSDNQDTCTFTVTVRDNENPTLTNCPVSFTLTVVLVTDLATTDWTLPTAADNSGMVTLSTNREPGQQLPPGQYSVTYTATDPAGLIAACPTFIITVQATGISCDSSPCSNDGVCSASGNSGFTCTCTALWTGVTCQEAVNGCTAGLCNNGGVCSASGNSGFTCACTPSWTGARCQEDFNECGQSSTNQACSNRGLTCINKLNGSTCDCPTGYFRAGNSDNCILGKSFRISIVIVEIFRDPLQAVFTNDLNNPNSVAFLTHQARLQILFAVAFGNLVGFGNVVVLFFTDGSIEVDAVVTFDPNSPVTQVDVDNALRLAITSGDLLMNSRYKVTPSASQVIEEVCPNGYCQNGGSCAPTDVTYLSFCTCPSGYGGTRCESVTVTDAPPTPVDGLSIEAIVAIAIGAAILLVTMLLIMCCVCYLMAGGRRGRSGYLYREDYEGHRHPKRHQNGSVYDIHFRPHELQNEGFRPATSHFAIPYVATGEERPIPLYPMERGVADYY